MKTLVFCTSYCTSEQAWEDRHAIWVKSLRTSRLKFDQLLIVDDASPVLPDWPGLTIMRETDAPIPEDVVTDEPLLLYTHETRLGRQSVFEFPGWYRSFAFGVLYGVAHGFEKIIHIESDAHLVSERLQIYFNEVRQGWASLWCEAYKFPEIAIQVAAGSALAEMVAFVKEPYAQLEGRIHEFLIPLTHVERLFVGNRYGEMIGHVPPQADYSTQTHTGLTDTFYWWIPPEPHAKPDRPRPRFGVGELRSPFGVDVQEGSWAGPDDGYTWMLDFDSSLFMPSVEQDGAYDLDLDVFPCTHRDRTSQRLYVLVNERLVNAVSVYRRTTITCLIPPGLLHTNRLNRVRFLHPDAFAPHDIDGHPETRQLGFGLIRCEFLHRPDADEPSRSSPLSLPTS